MWLWRVHHAFHTLWQSCWQSDFSHINHNRCKLNPQIYLFKVSTEPSQFPSSSIITTFPVHLTNFHLWHGENRNCWKSLTQIEFGVQINNTWASAPIVLSFLCFVNRKVNSLVLPGVSSLLRKQIPGMLHKVFFVN